MISISFLTSFIAIFQIFLMGAVGFLMIRCGWVNEPGLRVISWVVINITFPFYIFNQILNHFDPSIQANWWAYPLINIGLCSLGVLMAAAVVFLFRKTHAKEWMAICGFHNAGYIPLLLIAMLPGVNQNQELYSFVLLTIVGFDLCLWSLGVWLIAYRKKSNINWCSFINPPLISMFLAFIFVLSGVKVFLPEIFLKPIKIMGEGALALAMLTIGGNLALTDFRKIQWKQISSAVIIKLVLLPLIVLLLLKLFKVNNVWGFILMVQACMPTSITLSVIARNYDNPNQNLINHTIFITHVLCGLTIPIFLGLYGRGF